MANKIPVSSLIADFQLMQREHWAYRLGAAQRGEVDCSGAFVWAYAQHGASIYHGSNRIARVEVISLIPIGVANIVPGMVAFKHHKPGESGYALPAGYMPDGNFYNGDLNDYYHMGLIDTDTSRVLNARSKADGFVSSPISQDWSHVALLRQVDYSDQSAETPTYGSATVYAENGAPVKLRKTASTKLPYLALVPVGATVEKRGEDQDGWTPVSYNGQDGYMMSQFLTAGSSEGDAYTVTIHNLTHAQASALAQEYASNNPTVTPASA